MAEPEDTPRLSQLWAMPGLADIGPAGQASQSSRSKWSRANDAQNAFHGGGRDFAFHTAAEDAPWWALRFDEPKQLQYLVLENRKNPKFRHLADHLTVDVETTQGWVTMHSGSRRFGTEEDDTALVIPLADTPPITRIKITAHTAGGYFHLSRVRILAKADGHVLGDAQDKPLYFVANRTDGFGERLRAVLNAMVAADHFGGKMLLGWQTRKGGAAVFHAINDAERTFAPSFLSGRLTSPETIEHLGKITAEEAIFNENGHLNRTTGMEAIILDQRPIGRQIKPLAKIPSKPLYCKAFEEMEFAPALETARRMAREAKIGDDCTAVHLRAGDIIYGKFRMYGSFTKKAMPYPLCEALVEKACKTGGNVILFGQDEDLCRYIARKHGVSVASDFAAGTAFDQFQLAMFEICLMSRCAHIYSGSSGFAILASWIGKANSRPIDTAFDEREIFEQTYKSLQIENDAISDFQKAFANFYIFQGYGDQLSDVERRDVLRSCIAADPENVLYRIIDAAYLYSNDEETEAETRIGFFSRLNLEWDLAWSLEFTASNNMIRHYLPAFEAPAEAGYPMAALCLALRNQALGNMDEAARYGALYRANKGDLDTPLEARLNV